MEVALAGKDGKVISKEESATSESSSSVVEKDVGNKHVLTKESSFAAEQTSKMVAESVQKTANSVVTRKVSSSSVVSQTSSVTSSKETNVSQVKSITQG